ERAALYDRPVVAAAVGGIPEQSRSLSRVTLVSSDVELRAAMWAAATGGAPRARPKPWPQDGERLWERVQDEVRSRAAAARGSALTSVTSADNVMAERANAATAALRRLQSPALTISSERSARAWVKRLVRR